jgi:murein DD-endopeptidase MepM/ murein hydrolase activator NlpD
MPRTVVFRTLIIICLALLPLTTYGAATPDEIKQRIDESNKKLKELEHEIVVYQSQLSALGSQKKTLNQTIQSLDISRQKIATDIKVTENRISTADLTIEQLSLDIEDKEQRIDNNTKAIEKAIRNMHKETNETFIERLLSKSSFASAWQSIDVLNSFQLAVGERVENLQDLRMDLTDKKVAQEEKRQELASLRRNLSGQKVSLDSTRSEQNRLLSITKKEESNFQKLLREKEEAKKAFEAELMSLENELKFAIDPSLIPTVGKGVLMWPLDKVNITQYFGNTAFSTKNPQIYNGGGHNGIDLAAQQGTKVKAALSGIVEATGNTDMQRGCYSYGKWVLIRHPNNIHTLYAHLSAINASEGEEIRTGEVIGYSGNTGYSTGPHLHFAVFASQGVRVMKFGEFRKSSSCSNVAIPVASKEAYLNPLSYL